MDIKIFLRDKNGEIVDAWKTAFLNYENVKISSGNIFDSWRGFHAPQLCCGNKGMKPEANTLREQPYPDHSAAGLVDLEADAIISPANSFGFMDGGIDLIYSEYFGWDLEKKLQEIIRDKFYGEIPVGAAAIIKTNNKKIKYLISAPTMRVPADVSNTVNAYLAFRASLIEIKKFNESNIEKIESVLCPGLGTLTGNISPKNCAIQMKYAYDSIIENRILFPNSLNEACFGHKHLI